MKNRKYYKEQISSGAIGVLYSFINPDFPQEPLYTIRIHPHNQINIDLWKTISSHTLKPISIPNFYGSFIDDLGDVYTLYDYLPNNLMTFFEERQINKRISLSQIHGFYKNIVNALAFLQDLQISHVGLSLENVFLNLSSTRAFLMDFVKENEFENNFFFSNFLKSINKNSIVNPYKLNVFALGLTILELCTSKFPKSFLESLFCIENFENLINEQIQIFENIYDHINTEFEKKLKLQLKEIIKHCLILNEENRPDFLAIFWTNSKNDSHTLQKVIYINEDIFREDFEKIILHNQNESGINYANT